MFICRFRSVIRRRGARRDPLAPLSSGSAKPLFRRFCQSRQDGIRIRIRHVAIEKDIRRRGVFAIVGRVAPLIDLRTHRTQRDPGVGALAETIGYQFGIDIG